MPDFKNSITQNGVPVALDGHTHGIAIPRGTSFPLGPAQYDLFQRTDLGEICEYDGTRWLGQIDRMPFNLWSTYAPWTVNAWPFVAPIPGESIYLLSFVVSRNVATTNNASNYWTIYIDRDTTNIAAIHTAGHAANTTITSKVDINAVANVVGYLLVRIVKTGSPGGINLSPAVKFRKVYT